jgi:malonyl-CoA O-methyltransferase
MYDQLAHVQCEVADRLMRTLASDRRPERVLDIGCGTGYLTRRLAELWPQAWVEGVDFAPGMIDQARRRMDRQGRPLFTLADATTFEGTPPHATYDCLVSASSLQWMPPLGRTLAHLADLLRPGGRFAFAVMLDETLRELHGAVAAVVPSIVKAAMLPSSTEVYAGLAAAGLACTESFEDDHVVHAPSAAALLRDLHDIGATGSLEPGRPLLTRRQMRLLCEHYDAHFRDALGVVATYRVGIFRGVRDAAPR